MKFKDRKINSIKELIKALSETIQPKEIVWFRGQSDKNWELNPSLSRLQKGIDAELALIKRFKQNAIPFSRNGFY